MINDVVTGIRRIEPDAHAQTIVRVAQNQNVVPAEAGAKVVPVEKSEKADAKPARLLPVTDQSDVVLKFQVNDKTHEIMVFVVDRASDRVLRAIPPDELRKMSAGDLLKLAA